MSVIAVVGMVAYAIPDNDSAIARISLLLGSLAGIIAVLGNLVKTDKVQEKTEQVDTKVDRILNGEGQAKMEAALTTVLERHGIITTGKGNPE